MRIITCDARYERHVLAALAIAMNDIRHDIALRSDDDANVRALAWVPEQVIDRGATGTCAILVGVVNDPAALTLPEALV